MIEHDNRQTSPATNYDLPLILKSLHTIKRLTDQHTQLTLLTLFKMNRRTAMSKAVITDQGNITDLLIDRNTVVIVDIEKQLLFFR